MPKRDYFLIVDTESSLDNFVADFGAVITDRRGRIYHSAGVLVRGVYDQRTAHPLFTLAGADGGSLWNTGSLAKRYRKYENMLESGQRVLAGVGAINRWLDKVNAKYKPILTAYNLPFDTTLCANSGIDLDQFNSRFCLWAAAFSTMVHSKKFRQFVIENHFFNAPTANGNMTFKTDAETIGRFILGADLASEPHTALEDITGYELPILTEVLRRAKKRQSWLKPNAYDWRAVQVKNWFKAI